MIDLKQILNKTITELNDEGKIEEIFKKHVTSAFDDTVKDLLKWSGPLKKEIEKHLAENIKLNLGSFNMANYNEYIAIQVNKLLHEQLTEESYKAAKVAVSDLLKTRTETQKEYYLEEFLRKICSFHSIDLEDVDKVGREDGGALLRCSLYVYVEDYFTYVYFDTEEGKEKYQCKYRLHLQKDTNKIEGVNASIKGKYLDTIDSFLVSCKYEGVVIKDIKNISDEEYELDISDNYEEYELYR